MARALALARGTSVIPDVYSAVNNENGNSQQPLCAIHGLELECGILSRAGC